VDVVRLDADLFDLDLGMVLRDVAQALPQELFEGPHEDPPPVLRDPAEMGLVLVGSMGARANLHAPIISETWPAEPAQPAAGGFHPRAPQPQA
jgi:hypothetical protein